VRSVLVIGSGPAAAGAALALVSRPDLRVTVLDIGAELDAEHRAAVARLAGLSPRDWPGPELESISRPPVARSKHELPEKRAYGSGFALVDYGQRDGIDARGRADAALVSGAYGGLSNIWGAQVMPFSAASLAAWPISAPEMAPHYRAVCQHLPVSGEHDDLDELFPHPECLSPLPPLSARTVMVLSNYVRHRDRLRRLGITVGHARLALRAASCVRCGLCMTGCPYSLIYSASQTFDGLRAAKRLEYRSGLVVHRVGENFRGAVVHARETRSGQDIELTADRVYLACGALGTTRLVLGSLALVGREVTLAESAQFIFPALSVRPAPDPRGLPDFTLGQFNMVVDYGPAGPDGPGQSQVQFYCYNPAVAQALPDILSTRLAAPVATQVLSRLTIGLGYLPSWASPRLRAKVTSLAPGRLPPLELEQGEWPAGPPALRQVLCKLLRSAALLDLWPVIPQLVVARGGMSYHFGGSFPHRPRGTVPSPLTTDRVGRPPAWQRVHLVDGSVFPTVPATTFVLTLMANAHRIASESLALDDDQTVASP
jgi:ferredoxin